MTWQEKFINQVVCGDAIKEMAEIPDDSIDSCITDPPYGLEFMGKEWDKLNKHYSPQSKGEYPKSRNVRGVSYEGTDYLKIQKWHQAWAFQLYRILKPGAYLLAFGGTRTEHRLACGIEDAGFILRDRIAWLYGSGFPKNYDVSKGFDKQDTKEFRELVGETIKKYRELNGLSMDELCEKLDLNSEGHGGMVNHYENGRATPTLELWKKICQLLEIEKINNYREQKTGRLKEVGKIENPISWFGEGIKKEATSNIAKHWDGWGTALKPAFEFIVLAQKPLDKNYCHNLEKWGCGAMNIDGGRVGGVEPHHNYGRTSGEKSFVGKSDQPSVTPSQGRWPANLILECTCEKVIPGKAGERKEIKEHTPPGRRGVFGKFKGKTKPTIDHNDSAAIHTNPDCPCRMLDEESGELTSGARIRSHDNKNSIFGFGGGESGASSGGASRFFKYIPKADRAEKEAGLKENVPCVKCGGLNSETHFVIRAGAFGLALAYLGFPIPIVWLAKVNCVRNDHPTVKPVELFRYLQVLFTPTKGITIDPFAGAGTSGMAALEEGFKFINIDQDEGYCRKAEFRIKSVKRDVYSRLFKP